MQTYVILFKYTQQGIEKIKESPNRVKSLKEYSKEQGVHFKTFYSLMGRYDVMLILEAENAEAVAKVTLKIGSLGNVRSESLRAFSEQEFGDIVKTIE